jgi:hypothetical protein
MSFKLKRHSPHPKGLVGLNERLQQRWTRHRRGYGHEPSSVTTRLSAQTIAPTIPLSTPGAPGEVVVKAEYLGYRGQSQRLKGTHEAPARPRERCRRRRLDVPVSVEATIDDVGDTRVASRTHTSRASFKLVRWPLKLRAYASRPTGAYRIGRTLKRLV